MDSFIKRSVYTVVFMMLILNLFSCSVKKIFVDDNVVSETTSAYYDNYYMTNDTAAMRMVAKTANDSFAMNESAIEEDISDIRKIIKIYNITGETKTFDQSYQLLMSEIKRLNGIIDNQSIDNQNIVRNQRQKNLYMIVRIPSDKADEFDVFLNNNINILSKNESQEDITDSYNDSKLRIDTLKKEQKRLNELFAKAKTVEDLVKIENRISDIGYEIQRLENRISNFDKKVNYSTFNVNISEVVLYTETENLIPTKDDLLIKFNENFERCKYFVVGIGIYIFTHLPAIALCLIVVLIVLLFLQLILNNIKYKKNKDSNEANKIDAINKNELSNKISLDKDLSKQVVSTNDSISQIKKDVTNNSQKISIPKTTHYGNVAIREMSDTEIEHDKQKKAMEDKKYNESKNNNDNNQTNTNDEVQQARSQNVNSQDITDIKTLLEQKVDE